MKKFWCKPCGCVFEIINIGSASHQIPMCPLCAWYKCEEYKEKPEELPMPKEYKEIVQLIDKYGQEATWNYIQAIKSYTVRALYKKLYFMIINKDKLDEGKSL